MWPLVLAIKACQIVLNHGPRPLLYRAVPILPAVEVLKHLRDIFSSALNVEKNEPKLGFRFG